MSPGQDLRAIAPSVEFPLTICVLCYGRNVALARRFLSSLYSNTPPSCFVLRAGLNEVESATYDLFEEYRQRFQNVELYIEYRNRFKSPLMRRMFREKPITSNWIVWCDDDTHFIRPDWLQRHSPETAMWGWMHVVWTRDESVLNWIRNASWYGDQPFRTGVDLEGVASIEFRFATGAFWALKRSVLNQLDWPDPRLIQAADDFLLGEALRQNGREIGNFHHGVAINDAPRRNAAAVEHTDIQP